MNVLHQVVYGLDLGVYHFLNGLTGNWLIDHLAIFEEGNNLFKGGLFFAMYAYLWFQTDTRRVERRNAILAIFAGTLLALVVSRTIADLSPYRLRPMYDLHLSHHANTLPTALNMEEWSSFPSDTAAYFFALAFGLVSLLRGYSGMILLYTAGWICLPRMFLGEHYLSDIVVGAAIGIAAVKVSVRSEWLRQNLTSPLLRFMHSKPHVFYAAGFLVVFEMGVLFDDVRGAARGLFHALRGAHSHELFRAIVTSIGVLGAVLAGFSLLFTIFTRRHPALSNGFGPVRITFRRRRV